MGAVLQAWTGKNLDGSPVPLGSTATHEPTEISKSLLARWKSLEDEPNHPKPPRVVLYGQTDIDSEEHIRELGLEC